MTQLNLSYTFHRCFRLTWLHFVLTHVNLCRNPCRLIRFNVTLVYELYGLSLLLFLLKSDGFFVDIEDTKIELITNRKMAHLINPIFTKKNHNTLHNFFQLSIHFFCANHFIFLGTCMRIMHLHMKSLVVM